MIIISNLNKHKVCLPLLFLMTVFLGACQSVPPDAATPSETDVCVGEPIVVQEGEEVDLEALANQADCPE